jgi:PadR family transcriptional regulator, regulatory protein PadR
LGKTKNSRHTSAFLLLFLAEAPGYGAQLLTRIKTELPFCFSDSPSVYRSLQELEDKKLVETRWEIFGDNQPRKFYSLTPKGWQALEEFKVDIVKRRANFDFFLQHFQGLNLKSISPERR